MVRKWNLTRPAASVLWLGQPLARQSFSRGKGIGGKGILDHHSLAPIPLPPFPCPVWQHLQGSGRPAVGRFGEVGRPAPSTRPSKTAVQRLAAQVGCCSSRFCSWRATAGMVKLGNFSTDGTKMEANASRHKAMSYGYMLKELARLEQRDGGSCWSGPISVDAEQDAALGSRRGDELPEELKRREDRLAKIREAKARLEAEAREPGRGRAAGTGRGGSGATSRREEASWQSTGTSRDDARRQGADELHRPRCENHETQQQGLRLLLQRAGHGGRRAPDYCGGGNRRPPRTTSNKQYRWPKRRWPTLAAAGIERPRDEQGQPLPIPNTADSGYYSAANVQGVTDAGLDLYFAVGRDKHHASEPAPCSDVPSGSADTSPTPAASSGTAAENPKTAMAKKVREAPGRTLYAARKHIVEPVFGQIKRIRGFRKFLLRGQVGRREAAEKWSRPTRLTPAHPASTSANGRTRRT